MQHADPSAAPAPSRRFIPPTAYPRRRGGILGPHLAACRRRARTHAALILAEAALLTEDAAIAAAALEGRAVPDETREVVAGLYARSLRAYYAHRAPEPPQGWRRAVVRWKLRGRLEARGQA